MVKRRTTILGLGALAMGSGAAFTSAALENSLEAGADFRVIVEDDLVVEAGAAFRGTEGAYNPGDNYTVDTSDESENVFNSNSLDEVGLEELPAAAISDDQNEDLDIEVATGLDNGDGEEDSLGDFLQVRNEGDTTRNVAFGFSEFGDAVADGVVSSVDVIEVYEFKDDEGEKISTNDQSWDAGGDGDVGADEQGPAGYVTVEPGETEQITLEVDTRGVASDIIAEADGHENPFEGDHVTVDLVDEIFVGTENEDSQNSA